MIYSIHHFYSWVKGGVETGQAYRARIFREMGLEAKFIFATTFPDENIQHETEYLGFLDSEVIWLYGYFTDCRLSPVTYTLERLEESFGDRNFHFSREGTVAKYNFPDTGISYSAYMADGAGDCVHRVMVFSNGNLIRKDYYTYCKIYSEYYAPVAGKASLYLRRFFNENGTAAYEEIIEGDLALYKFPDRILYSREELAGYLMSCLHLTEDDVVLIDGEPGMIDRAAFIQNSFPARVGFVLHSDHFLESDEEHILWYGIYEYALAHPEKISFYITSTQAQSDLLREQLQKYKGVEAVVLTIPVMGLDELKMPAEPRRRHSLISAGRLSKAKQMDWVIEAVVKAKEKIPDLSLDIYGEGAERDNLCKLIDRRNCGGYVRLCGHQKLDEVYQKYEAYISGSSFVETFGITMLEAVGSGLALISFDIRYGSRIFIDEGENGYRVPIGDEQKMAEGIVRLFTEADREAFRRHSYEKAQLYLTGEVKRKWENVLCRTT